MIINSCYFCAGKLRLNCEDPKDDIYGVTDLYCENCNISFVFFSYNERLHEVCHSTMKYQIRTTFPHGESSIRLIDLNSAYNISDSIVISLNNNFLLDLDNLKKISIILLFA